MSIDPVQAVADRQALRLWLGIGLTLGLLALSVLTLWVVDNVVVSVGPFDRGSLGWVAAPLWLLAPVGGGYVWSSLSVRWTRVAAGVVGVIVSGAASLAVWQWFGTPLDCGFGTVTPAIDFLTQTVLVGVLVGGGLALTAALVTELVRLGVRWWAVVVGVGMETVLVVVTYFIFFAIGGSHTCFVPGPDLGQP